MKKSFPAVRSQGPESDFDGIDQVYEQGTIVPTTLITIAESSRKNEQSWSLNSQIPTDLIIQVQDVTFSVHKYPLVSKCGYISHLELQPSISNFGYELKLENFPGGSETFELILRFCYDLPLDLNPTNIAPLRCAAEFLEMSEEFEDGNLISKTEAFLTFIILSSWKDTISVLKSCETLSPWAENLQIVRRCSDSIAWKASTENSVNEEKINEEGWRFEDMATLRIDHFTRIMTAIKAKGAKAEITGKCIMHYAARWLPGTEVELEGLRGYGKNELHFRILCGRKEHEDIGHSNEQRTILESLISILPPQQEAVTCKFLLKMLRMAMVYSASPALISELEKRVGITLENANANDLLIPNYKIEDQGKMPKTPETMHNTDVVQRIIEYFLMHEQEQQQLQAMPGKFTVGKLLDNYLADIARDPNLSTSKFQVLAESLPENARTCDDGLYRAIDTYLKVLLAEQVKVRLAMQGKEPKATASGNSLEQETKQPSTETEIMALKKELENVKTKIAELHRDYSELQHEYARLNNKQKNILGWSFGWKKIRESALFPRKVDADETEEEQRRSNPLNSQRSFRRRMSIS
uniref:Root phototropism protein n=1 Tax=Rhizophora mucronata TaxID=61149 RepID=A0A2P2KIC0_RHIMU